MHWTSWAPDMLVNTAKPVCTSVYLGVIFHTAVRHWKCHHDEFARINNGRVWDAYLIAHVYESLGVCVSGGGLLFPGSLTIWIISSAFSLWTPGEVAAVGHSGTGALPEPHSQLYTRLHCGCGGLRHYKSVSLIKYWHFYTAGPLSVRFIFLF